MNDHGSGLLASLRSRIGQMFSRDGTDLVSQSESYSGSVESSTKDSDPYARFPSGIESVNPWVQSTDWTAGVVRQLEDAIAAFQTAQATAESVPDSRDADQALVTRARELNMAWTIVDMNPEARQAAEAKGIEMDVVADDARDLSAKIVDQEQPKNERRLWWTDVGCEDQIDSGELER